MVASVVLAIAAGLILGCCCRVWTLFFSSLVLAGTLGLMPVLFSAPRIGSAGSICLMILALQTSYIVGASVASVLALRHKLQPSKLGTSFQPSSPV